VAADRRVVEAVALEQAERLGEVACRDADVVAVRAQPLDHRAQHDDVRAIGEVDPDAHRVVKLPCAPA
jgi:hypothetical protein